MPKHKKNQPEFIVFTGPMFSGKTSCLLSVVDRYKIRGADVLCVKPKIDNRYSTGEIVTHAKYAIPALEVSSGKDILRLTKNLKPDAVAVDEAFMIDGSGEALVNLFMSGVSVFVSSLELSSGLEPFHEISKILPYATKVKKCAAVCTKCGSDAYTTLRKTQSVELIEVGGVESYEPVCWVCHPLSTYKGF